MSVKIFSKNKIYLDLGHVGIFKKLISFSNLNKDDEKNIKELIKSKSSSEIKKYINSLDVDEKLKECICNFPKDAWSNRKYFERIKIIFKNFNLDIENDVKYMIDLCNLIDSNHNDVEIKYDFCELQGFDYENGIL